MEEAVQGGRGGEAEGQVGAVGVKSCGHRRVAVARLRWCGGEDVWWCVRPTRSSLRACEATLVAAVRVRGVGGGRRQWCARR